MSQIADIIPASVCEIARQLRAAGYEAYAVGGCVRDTLLGRVPHDWDLTTSATPAQMKDAVTFPAVDTGIAHGTVSFIADGTAVETTTFRTDGSYSDGRHPDQVTFARTLEEDLARRDFTINAMAWSPDTGVVDPFGGARDLEARRLRCVGDALTRCTEDGLRIMRGLRIAATYELAIEPDTANAFHRMKRVLNAVANERIQVELSRMMAAPNGQALAAIVDEFSDIFMLLFPELAPAFEFSESGTRAQAHGMDSWQHSLAMMAALPADTELRLAALLHCCDVPTCDNAVKALGACAEESARSNPQDMTPCKPSTPAVTPDDASPCGINAASASRVARHAFKRLKFPRASVEGVASLIAGLSLPTNDNLPTARRFLAHAGSAGRARQQLALIRADWTAIAAEPANEHGLAHFAAQLEDAIAQNSPTSPRDLVIGGADLIATGWQEGPGLGRELGRLFEMVLDGKLPNERATLLEEAMRDTPRGT